MGNFSHALRTHAAFAALLLAASPVVSGFSRTASGPPEGGHYRDLFPPSSVASFFSRTQPAGSPLLKRSFVLDGPAEVVATIHASCARCDWSVAGREAAALEITVDGQYRSHLLLTRGRDQAEYQVLAGRFERGPHDITVALDRSKSARGTGAVRVTGIDVTPIGESDPAFAAVAHAPILHARPDTIGRFSDVPLLMWYETTGTARGRLYQYSVIFSNEDGGTATDRLMATWGRTSDIELVYSVEIGANGRTLAEEFQGPDHVITPFRGAYEALHPIEFVVTDNNMVSDTGTASVRYAPAPELFDLTGRSREAVMDAHPWSYRVASQELMREGKISDQAEPGSRAIPDPRRFVIVEACADLENAALSFGVRAKGSSGAGGAGRAGGSSGSGGSRGSSRSGGAGGSSGSGGSGESGGSGGSGRSSGAAGGSGASGGSGRSSGAGGSGGSRGSSRSGGSSTGSGASESRGTDGWGWYDSDRGRPDFRIVRTGCFRGAVPLPRDAAPPDAIRFRAWPRGETNVKPASVRVTRVNKIFTLGEDFQPGPSQFSWTGSLLLTTDGTPAEFDWVIR
jgi:hypothetical protein